MPKKTNHRPRRKRDQARREPPKPVIQIDLRDENRVLTFREWCTVNNFSVWTGRRLVKNGEGPRILQLSARRPGVRVRDNIEWQESRARTSA